METFSNARLAFVFGLLGNFISCFLYLAPLSTFYEICRRRRLTENYQVQAIPYSMAIFTAIMLMLYYACLKGNAFMLITINSVGCGVEIVYLFLFFAFANSNTRMRTAQLFIAFSTAVFMLVVTVTSMVSPEPSRLTIVGWVCAGSSVCVYAFPLSNMRQVIRTKSAEYMAFAFSLCLTLCAIVWFLYGFFTHDFFVAAPNILGFVLGGAQMILNIMYRRTNEPEPQEEVSEMTNVATSSARDDIIEIADELAGLEGTDASTSHVRNVGNGSTVTADATITNDSGNGRSHMTLHAPPIARLV